MSRYEVEWPCCGDVTITNGYEPSECPFCTPVLNTRNLVKVGRVAELWRAADGAHYLQPVLLHGVTVGADEDLYILDRSRKEQQ